MIPIMESRKETKAEPAPTIDDQAGPKPTAPKPAAAPVPSAKGKAESGQADSKDKAAPEEIGGRPGPDPTRYGDWEIKGRCVDF